MNSEASIELLCLILVYPSFLILQLVYKWYLLADIGNSSFWEPLEIQVFLYWSCKTEKHKQKFQILSVFHQHFILNKDEMRETWKSAN